MKHQENGKFNVIIRQSILGSLAGILFLTISAAMLSALILNGSIPERRMKYFVLALIVISVFLGTVIGRKGAEEYRKTVCIITGITIFCFMLLVTAILFGGEYTGVGETGLLILCGCTLPLFVGPYRTKKKKTGSRMVKLYKKSR